MATPYDNKVALWYVHGRTVGENTLRDILTTIRRYAPAVEAIWVKSSEGTEWAGNLSGGDPKPDLAIRGPADIDRWVREMGAANIDVHLWHVAKGTSINAEADLLIQACSRPGVKSLILDIEPYAGFWQGGRAGIRPFMLRLRSALPGTFHIGMSVDPRPWHYDTIFPEEWRPFINSIHPQIYWADFSLSPDDAYKLSYQKWGGYGLPIIPALQGYQGSGNKITKESMDRARELGRLTYRVPGLSWFRFGTLNRTLFPAVNVTMAGTVPNGDDDDNVSGRYGTEIIVRPGQPRYQEGTYDGTPSPLLSWTNEDGQPSRYGATSAATSTVWVRWDPQLPAAGFWEVSAYVPSQHGTTRNARFKVNGIVNLASDFEVAIRQAALDSVWASLGIFQFDPARPNSGVVFLNDLTGEGGRQIVFDALRWRQVIGWTQPPRYLADGFDSPVGSAEERRLIVQGWPPLWRSTNPYGNLYSLLGRQSLHTGDDLVLRQGKTFGEKLYATASGVVVSARREGSPPNWGSWGNVIVIRHDKLVTTGNTVYSRYAHVDNMQVRAGERVVRGQHIANISDAYGVFRNVPHLHFDISPSQVLEVSPGDWPWLDRTRLERDYANPRLWIVNNRPAKP